MNLQVYTPVDNTSHTTDTDTLSQYLHPAVFCSRYCGDSDQHGVPPVNCLQLLVHLEPMRRSLVDRGKDTDQRGQSGSWTRLERETLLLLPSHVYLGRTYMLTRIDLKK